MAIRLANLNTAQWWQDESASWSVPRVVFDQVQVRVALLNNCMDSPVQGSSSLIGDSDDEFDWEEVQVPQVQHLEITLKARPTQTAINK